MSTSELLWITNDNKFRINDKINISIRKIIESNEYFNAFPIEFNLHINSD